MENSTPGLGKELIEKDMKDRHREWEIVCEKRGKKVLELREDLFSDSLTKEVGKIKEKIAELETRLDGVCDLGFQRRRVNLLCSRWKREKRFVVLNMGKKQRGYENATFPGARG